MLIARVIPSLLLKNSGLVKGVKFRKHRYVGDPLNAMRIFNEKEVDELIFLDINATAEKRKPPFDMIRLIASECFMPVCYGGGSKEIDDIRKTFGLGIEKVSIGSYSVEKPQFIKEASEEFGSQSIVVCIDVKRGFLGNYEVVTHNGKKKWGLDPVSHAVQMEEMGAGELLVNSVDRDGTMKGYDITLIKKITGSVSIPVIARGGAGRLDHIREVIKAGEASAACAGSLFVFFGKNRAILINYPERRELEKIFNGIS
jgi:imidazole glycerol-phosphate synthase subunit HisF